MQFGEERNMSKLKLVIRVKVVDRDGNDKCAQWLKRLVPLKRTEGLGTCTGLESCLEVSLTHRALQHVSVQTHLNRE